MLLQIKHEQFLKFAVSLHNKGYKAIVMVVGSDRVDEFEKFWINITVLTVVMVFMDLIT